MRPSSPAGSPPSPDFIPSLSDVLHYFSGTLRLMAGKPDGLKRLDLSADGFWNSFAAIPVALPPTLVAWIEYESNRQSTDTSGVGVANVYFAHALADLTAWLFPILVLALAARPMGLTRRFVPLVVSLNWCSALLAWCFAPVWLVLLLVGAPGEGSSLLSLLMLAASVILTMRLVAAATGRDPIFAAAVVAITIASALVAYIAVADLTGLALA